MNVSATASLYYKTYSFQNSDEYKNNSVDTSAISKEYYNTGDITDLFNSVDNTADFSTITNVSEYAKNKVDLSQSSQFNNIEFLQNNSFNIAGNLDSFAQEKYNESSFDILKNESSINIDGIISPTETAESEIEASNLNNNTDSYTSDLNNSDLGSIFDIKI